MGLWNFMVDMSQEGKISELQDRVDELEKKTEILYEWVQYLKQQLEVQKND